MKKNTNLSLLWILLLIAGLGMAGLVWRTAKLLQKPAESDGKDDIVATTAATEVSEPPVPTYEGPLSASAITETAQPTVQTYEEPLSQEELYRQIRQIFQEKLTEPEVRKLLLFVHMPLAGEAVARTHIRQADNLHRLSVSLQEAEELLTRAFELKRKNILLTEQKREREYQAWRETLPLNVENLDFTQNAYGAPLLRKEPALCPSMRQGHSSSAVCHTLFFEDGSSSFVVFQSDFLRRRDDYSPNGEILQSFEFDAPSVLISENDGQAARMAAFYNQPSFPDKRIEFASDGTVTRATLTDTKKPMQYTYEYDGDYLTFSVYNTSLDDMLHAGTAYEQWFFELAKLPEGSPASAVVREGTYEKNYSFKGDKQAQRETGTWTMNPQKEIITDKRRVFPSAASWGTPPHYCQTYPHDCRENAQKLL